MKPLRTAVRATGASFVCSDLCLARLLANGARTFHTQPPRLRQPTRGGGGPRQLPRSMRGRNIVIRRDRIPDPDFKNLRAELLDSVSHDKIRPSAGYLPRGPNKNFSVFQGVVDLRFSNMMREIREWTEDDEEYRSFNIHSDKDLGKCLAGFRKALNIAMSMASSGAATTHKSNPIFHNLRSGFIRDNVRGLDVELKYAFQTYASEQAWLTNQSVDAQLAMADMRYPHEWFPATRMMQRTVHLHVGPTNSGKTYHALKALENAKSGIYAGPLRLLAHEVYSRFQAKGIRCALITGEELRIPEGDAPYFQSCTVEMTPLNETVDVAVIDEIQMIADSGRGFAWTDAFFGVQAKELHLCGEARTVPLIQALCARIGDKCIVHRYERLNPLEAMTTPLGKMKNLEKGDCIVSFSRVALHALKAGVEANTGKRCAIVYGALPPETRAQQAALFNDPDNNYDFLVASDAIGMGLNLEIKRVIFEALHKRDDVSWRQLNIAEVKQIGGRAGRYRTAAREIRSGTTLDVSQPSSPSPGLVTSMEEEDLGLVQSHISKEPPPIEAAGIQLPHYIIENFARTMPPGTPLSFIILRLRELCRLSGRYFLCSVNNYVQIADIIQPYPLTIHDRCVLLTAPISLKDESQIAVLKAFAQCIAGLRSGHILDNLDRELRIDILDMPRGSFRRPGGGTSLVALESLHRSLTMYLWLSYRYPEVFCDQGLAFHIKKLCEEKIELWLEEVHFVPGLRAEQNKKIRQKIEEREKAEKEMGEILQGEHEEGKGPAAAGEYEGDEEPVLEGEEEAEAVEFDNEWSVETDDTTEGQEKPIKKLKWNETTPAQVVEQSQAKEKTLPLDQLPREQQRQEDHETRKE